MDLERLFKIRRAVRRSDDISDAAARLMCEIIDLHQLADGCTATDRTLGDFIDKSARTVARRRQELIDAGYMREEAGADRRRLVPKWPDEPDETEETTPDRFDEEPDKIDETPVKDDEKEPVKSDMHKEIDIHTPERERAREEAASRDDDPPGVQEWVNVTGERPNIGTRNELQAAFSGPDAPRWDQDIFRKALKEAYLNVGQDAHRIRVGYLLTSYEQHLTRSGDSMPDPDVEFNARGYKIQ